MNMVDIKDVKPPISPEGNSFIFWILMGGCFLLFAILGYILYKHYQGLNSKKQEPKLAWENAIERLMDLQRQDLLSRGLVQNYYVALSDITRRYVEDKFNIRAPEMTTEEFLSNLQKSDQFNDEARSLLAEFLKISDMVKFAQYSTSVQQAKDSFQSVQTFIEKTK